MLTEPTRATFDFRGRRCRRREPGWKDTHFKLKFVFSTRDPLTLSHGQKAEIS